MSEELDLDQLEQLAADAITHQVHHVDRLSAALLLAEGQYIGVVTPSAGERLVALANAVPGLVAMVKELQADNARLDESVVMWANASREQADQIDDLRRQLKVAPEQAAEWDIENPVKLNPADLNPGRHGPNQTGFSLLMVDDLRAWFSEDGKDMPLDDDYNLEWLIEEHGLEILQSAVRSRLKKNDENA